MYVQMYKNVQMYKAKTSIAFQLDASVRQGMTSKD